jgi:ribosomal-protein-alanine N-acetyltransferase
MEPAPATTDAFRDSRRWIGERVLLRRVLEADCGPRYAAWLADPEVNRYLETRWSPQDAAAILAFVRAMRAAKDSLLLAIVARDDGAHIGNLKLGPIQARHAHADVSYFIGERDRWGRGYASEAIALACHVAFVDLGLHRVQAGLYAGNVGSARALEKAGFAAEGCFKAQLRGPRGWEDHRWYGLVRDDWRPAPARSEG